MLKTISYGKQFIDDDDIASIVKVLKSDWLTQGPVVDLFEENLATYFGANYSCVVSNGTAALHLAGLSLGWKPGDIILTSPITFLASSNSIVYCGATPDFVDINPMTNTIDPNLVEEKIKNYLLKGKRVKAIIGVDYSGHPCDWKALRTIADNYNIKLINDNCHAMGAKYYNDKYYAVKYADIVTQSFHPVKHITTGEGGSILTNDQEIYLKVKSLRAHGLTKDSDRLFQNDGSWYYEMHELGYNYRLTDFQSALGISQLKKLEKFIIKRREIAHRYNKIFTHNKFFTIPEEINVEHAFHLYPLKINFNSARKEKSNFFEYMKKNKILLQVHYIPVHLQPYYAKNFGFAKGDFPKSEKFYTEQVSLPIYPNLLKKEQKFVIEVINTFFE